MKVKLKSGKKYVTVDIDYETAKDLVVQLVYEYGIPSNWIAEKVYELVRKNSDA